MSRQEHQRLMEARDSAVPAAAKGKRDGHVWIAAENDSFNKILVALGLWGEQSTERAKLFRLNPHLPPVGGSGANTPSARM